MTIDYYYMALSPPCRSVMMTAKMLGVEMNLKPVNLLTGEQMKPEFIKMNPMHTVPLIDDNGFYMTESRAICAYLVNKYGKNDQLYSKVPKERALIDMRLYFDLSVFYTSFSNYYYPVIFRGATSLDEPKKNELDNALGFFNGFLAQQEYAAGDRLSVADLALLASATTMEAVIGNIFDDYPNIKAWLQRCKSQVPDHHELNQSGADSFGQLGQAALAKL